MISDKSKLISTQICALSNQLNIDSHQLSNILGLSVLETESILLHESFIAENSPEWTKAALFIQLIRLLLVLVGNDMELAKSWLHSPNKAFNDQLPINLMTREIEFNNVFEYLSNFH